MTKDMHFPWHQYALIVKLAECLNHRPRLRAGSNSSYPQFGKTALQKLVYLLQAVYDVECDYDFSLYTYGPFTSELLQDLDLVESIGAVQVLPVRKGMDGYAIKPYENAAWVTTQAKEFLEAHKCALGKLIEEYGHYSAKELEIRATMIYVEREMKGDGKPVSLDGLVRVVHDIKPYFPRDEIKSVAEELQAKEHVKVAADG
ncbi:MAG: hypothetical protein OXM03_04180 [Chloroflexota bacterium]|nr:hypothetical protein [Chloroflexota bacterium]MDE2932037.1 hypothetical protein [Chloroflexota bacterium]